MASGFRTGGSGGGLPGTASAKYADQLSLFGPKRLYHQSQDIPRQNYISDFQPKG